MSVRYCSLGSEYSRFFSERRDSYQGTPISFEKPVEHSLRGAKTDKLEIALHDELVNSSAVASIMAS
jgi:hypothetical protein